MQKKSKTQTSKKINKSWYYLLSVIIAYLILLILNKNLFLSGMKFFLEISYQIIPVLIIIFLLMTILNYAISPKRIIKHLGEESGLKGWLIAIAGGIISHGPVYVWYPLLAELQERGMKIGLISCFLYNKAIKIPLLPFMIFYFSWKFVLVLIIMMIFSSIIQGIVIDKTIKLIPNNNKEVKNENCNQLDRQKIRK